MAYRAVTCQSAQGANHLRDDPPTPCQDASWGGKCGKNGVLAIVADGHGGKDSFRSQDGSEFAVKCAQGDIGGLLQSIGDMRLDGESARKPVGVLQKFLSQFRKAENDTLENEFVYPPAPRDFAHYLGELIRNIAGFWREGVIKKACEGIAADENSPKNNFRPEELAGVYDKYRDRFAQGKQLEKAYGTTLIACAATEDYWFGIQIGDGKCIAFYPDGSHDFPIPWDERCFLNHTTSLCDEDAWPRARFYYQTRNGDSIRGNVESLRAGEGMETGTDRKMPVMVFINTDGVDDSFPLGDNERHLSSFYRNNIAMEFVDTLKADPEKGFETVLRRLEDYLPKLSAQGSGDDISIAGFIDTDALLKLEPVLLKLAEEDKARKAREKEEEARANEENRIKAEQSKAAFRARELPPNPVRPETRKASPVKREAKENS